LVRLTILQKKIRIEKKYISTYIFIQKKDFAEGSKILSDTERSENNFVGILKLMNCKKCVALNVLQKIWIF